MRMRNLATLFLIGFAALSAMTVTQPAAASVMIGGVQNDFRPIILNSYRGLPRLGLQDTQGFAPATGMQSNLIKDKIRANPDQAQMVGAEIASHTYSLSLLARLDFHRRYADCSNGVDVYQGEIEQCAGRLLQHSMRVTPWNAHLETLARSLRRDQHTQAFCFDGPCGNKGLNRVFKTLPNGRTARLDEFELRDLFARLKGQYFAPLKTYYADKYFPTEAYYVDIAELGDYDFDNQQFNVRIRAPRTIGLQKNFAAGYISKPGQYKPAEALQPQNIALRYEIKNTFEQAFKQGDRPAEVPRQVALKMAPAQARAIVQSQTLPRRVYAVMKIGLGPSSAKEFEYNPLKRMENLDFHFAENKVEFYSDEALTDKIAEAPLVDEPVQTAQNDRASNVYTLRPNTMLLDSRAFNIMRLGLGDLLPSDMERPAYSLPTAERKVFGELDRRIEEAKRDVPAGNTAKSQQNAQLQKQRMKDAAQWSNIAWTDRASWTPAQRQAFFDYIMGYGPQTEPDWSAWPDALPSVKWGMNMATIFPYGYFDTDRASFGLLADAPTRATIQEFLDDVAAQYPITHLTGVYDLGGVGYDQKTKKLTFKRWPFAQQKSVTFADSVGATQSTVGGNFVHSDAKSRLIYNYVSTSVALGDEVPDRAISNCMPSDRRKSRDCGTQWGNFMQVQWYSTFFAFDRALEQPTLTFEPKRGQELAQRYRTWKLVVEYSKPEMKLVPYSYKGRNDKAATKTEAKTVFANIDRVLIIGPNDEIIWSQNGAQLKEARALTQTTAPEAAALDYSFPSPLPLAPGQQIEAAAYDFLLAKYAPSRLTDRMLDAMLSSRWQYEKNTRSPLGGRFFNQSALQPTSADVQGMRLAFKAWLTKMAARFPNKLLVDVPLQYANNTVRATGSCLKFEAAPGAPYRSNKASILAKQKATQCRTAYQQTKSKYNRCQGYAQGVSDAQSALDKAQSAGCDTPAVQAASASAPTGSCQINPNTDMAMLGQEMQRCMAQMCGNGPKTISSVQTYKTCLQSAQVDLQAQVQAIMSGGAATSTASNAPAANLSCSDAEGRLRQANLSLDGGRCEDAQTLAPEPSCDFTSEIVQPDFWQVGTVRTLNTRKCSADKVFLRSNKVASILLPSGAPYADTTLSLTVELDAPMMIPFDAPIQTQAPYNVVNAKTVLTLTGLKDAASDAGTMTFTARAGAVEYALP